MRLMTCKIDGCDSTLRGGGGWCNKHYKRWLRTGDPLSTKYKSADEKGFGYSDDGSAWIELSQEMRAVVDAADLEELCQYNWQYSDPGKGTPRAERSEMKNGRYHRIKMHRQILGITDPSVQVDHINRDALDNRRANLRPCNQTENNWNVGLARHNKSGFKGVSWSPAANKWAAWISVDNKNQYLGVFDDPIEAARTFDEAVRRLRGEFGVTNEQLGLLPEAV